MEEKTGTLKCSREAHRVSNINVCTCWSYSSMSLNIPTGVTVFHVDEQRCFRLATQIEPSGASSWRKIGEHREYGSSSRGDTFSRVNYRLLPAYYYLRKGTSRRVDAISGFISGSRNETEFAPRLHPAYRVFGGS